MSIDRLRAHWGLSRTPFTKELATSMLFASAAHQEAVARVGWIISERALGVVCGEVGAGKTVAARAASAGLDSSRHTIIYLPNPAIGARGIYTQIVTALGATPRFYRATLIPQATDLIAAETAERGKTVVLILDEAHLLGAEQLEELRMLTNAEMDSRATFACLLLGQPTLRRKLRQGTFAALDQRIALRCTIDGMDRKETGDWGIHLTGADPRPPRPAGRRSLQARWATTGAGRLARSAAGPWVGDEVSVAHRVVVGGEFEHAVEDEPAAARPAPVEAEHELIQVARQVGIIDRPLMGAEQPPLGE